MAADQATGDQATGDPFEFILDDTVEPGDVLPALAALLISLAERAETEDAAEAHGADRDSRDG